VVALGVMTTQQSHNQQCALVNNMANIHDDRNIGAVTMV